MIMVVDVNKYDSLAADLEKQELEAPNGVLPAQAYGQLLAIYLYQSDLCNAKFLWRRIPPNVETLNPELYAIWAVGRKMWKRDLPGTYTSIDSYNWSEAIAEIMKSLKEKVQEQAFTLIAKSYSAIATEAVSSMSGLSSADALRLCGERGWEVQEEVIVVPREPSPPPPAHLSSEDQLNKLTQFVSFLEN